MRVICWNTRGVPTKITMKYATKHMTGWRRRRKSTKYGTFHQQMPLYCRMDSLSLNWSVWRVSREADAQWYMVYPRNTESHRKGLQTHQHPRGMEFSQLYGESFIGRRRRGCEGRRYGPFGDEANREDAKKNGVNYGGLMDIPVNYGGSMDTLHETKKWNTLPKDYTHGKHVHSVYSIVFRGRHSWRNRKVKESSQFHFISNRVCFWWTKKLWVHTFWRCGEGRKTNWCWRMVAWWRHPGDGVLQIEVRVSLYEPLESLGRLDCRRLGSKLEFKEKKTWRSHYFGMDEGDDVPCHA